MKEENIQPVESSAEEQLIPASSEKNIQSAESSAGEQLIPPPTDKTLANAELAASASPDGTLTVTMVGMEGFMRIEEAEAKAWQEYLRGRNEAIEAQFGDPKATIEDSSSDSLSSILSFRQSIWD